VEHYYPKSQIAQILVEAHSLSVGDTMAIIGATTGVIQFTVDEIYVDEQAVQSASKGQTITIKVPERVRDNDKVSLIKTRVEYQN
jgi:putative protease